MLETSRHQRHVLAAASEMLEGDLYEVVALHRRHKTRGQLHRAGGPPSRRGFVTYGDAGASGSGGAGAGAGAAGAEYARRAAQVQKALCQQLHGTKPGGRRPTPPKRRARAASAKPSQRLPGADAPEIRVELNLSALFP